MRTRSRSRCFSRDFEEKERADEGMRTGELKTRVSSGRRGRDLQRKGGRKSQNDSRRERRNKRETNL